MGLVVFEDPIEHISGKISKKFRTCYNFRRASKRKYTSVRGDRTTPVSADETNQRIKFKMASLAALDRSMDLSKVSADQEVFLAERANKAPASSTPPTKVGCSPRRTSTTTRRAAPSSGHPPWLNDFDGIIYLIKNDEPII